VLASVFSPPPGHRNSMVSCIKLFKKLINLQVCLCTTKKVVFLYKSLVWAQGKQHKRCHTVSYSTTYFLTGADPLEFRVGLDGMVSTKHCSALLSFRTYRVVKSNRINDHEFFQMVFVRCVVPMPGYNVEGGEILAKQRDGGLLYTAFQLVARMQGSALSRIKNGFSAGERYTSSLEHKDL